MQGTITLTNGQTLEVNGLTLAGHQHRSITALVKEVKQIIHDTCQHDCNTAWNQAKRWRCRKCKQLVANPNK